jgi:hypothetical protein
MKEVKLIIVTAVITTGLFLCVTADNKPRPAKIVIPQPDSTSCFEYQVIIQRYDHTLYILEQRNPAAAREFDEIFHHETE